MSIRHPQSGFIDKLEDVKVNDTGLEIVGPLKLMPEFGPMSMIEIQDNPVWSGKLSESMINRTLKYYGYVFETIQDIDISMIGMDSRNSDGFQTPMLCKIFEIVQGSPPILLLSTTIDRTRVFGYNFQKTIQLNILSGKVICVLFQLTNNNNLMMNVSAPLIRPKIKELNPKVRRYISDVRYCTGTGTILINVIPEDLTGAYCGFCVIDVVQRDAHIECDTISCNKLNLAQKIVSCKFTKDSQTFSLTENPVNMIQTVSIGSTIFKANELTRGSMIHFQVEGLFVITNQLARPVIRLKLGNSYNSTTSSYMDTFPAMPGAFTFRYIVKMVFSTLSSGTIMTFMDFGSYQDNVPIKNIAGIPASFNSFDTSSDNNLSIEASCTSTTETCMVVPYITFCHVY
jgi:hypothetical protein